VYQDLFANVFNAWLVAGATYIWYFHKPAISIISDIVPGTVEWHRQSYILTYLVGSGCHEWICMKVVFSMNQAKVKARFVECSLQK